MDEATSLYESDDPDEIRAIERYLRERGVACEVASGAGGARQVLVAQRDLERAESLVADQIEAELNAEDDAARACSRCGDFRPTVEGSPDVCSKCIAAAYDRPWSPAAIGLLTFFFGFAGGGVLHALNAKRFGHRRSAALPIVGWLAAFVALGWLLALVKPELAMVALFTINAAMGVFFARAHCERFQVYADHGGKRASVLAAAGIVILVNGGASLLIEMAPVGG